jgi:hypothetical protein
VRLSVRHSFSCTPSEFWALYWAPEFETRLRRGSTVAREVVEERQEGTVTVRRVRVTPQQELPGPAAAILGTKKLVYEQESRYDSARGVIDWQVVPSFLPGKLDAKGSIRVDPAPGGCVMVVDGNIDVHVRFVGGQIEKAVVAEVEKSYDRVATETKALLAERKAQT